MKRPVGQRGPGIGTLARNDIVSPAGYFKPNRRVPPALTEAPFTKITETRRHLTKTLLACVQDVRYMEVTEALDVAPRRNRNPSDGDDPMKIWNKPQVREQAVGMEVTAYLPADIDLI